VGREEEPSSLTKGILRRQPAGRQTNLRNASLKAKEDNGGEK